MKLNFFGKMSVDHFLGNYWNKKPLLLKKVIPISQSNPLDFSDFIKMASDPSFETRVVHESGGDYPWQAKVGPFNKSEFKKGKKWTLICHNLEQYSDQLFQLKNKFNFIPHWHSDDVMATISEVGASVGAHIDDYSVFIFQGVGKRKWLLEENPTPGHDPDLDIRLLKQFSPHIEWILEPGDMLYIPPNVAHHGITIEKSISYSVGFKSIRYNNLLPYFLSTIVENIEDASFHDPKSVIATDPFLVPGHVSNAIQKEVIKLVSDKERFAETLLSFLATPKNINEDINELSLIEINWSLVNKPFYRDPWAKLTSRKISTSKYQIAVNDKRYLVGASEYNFIKALFTINPQVGTKAKKADMKNQKLVALLVLLVQDGVVSF
jgi:50S ribosomal protein L16 3-hydroxylase